MDKPFVPLFITSLSVLFFIYFFNIHHFILPPVIFIFFTLSFSFFILKKFRVSYILIIFAISLFIGNQYIYEKENYNNQKKLKITGTEYVKVCGKLTKFPETGKNKSYIFLKTKWIKNGKLKRNIVVNLKINVKGETPRLNRGETILIDTIIRDNHFCKNFYKNPIEEYLFTERIHFSGYTK